MLQNCHTYNNSLRNKEVFMHGNVYARQKCFICEKNLKHNESKGGCFCLDHTQVSATKSFYVKFKGVNKRFKNYQDAIRFLSGVRYKSYENSFDPKDYQKDMPYGFTNLALKYLKRKESKKAYGHIKNKIGKACEYFGQRNIKDINGGEIEDYLYSIKGKVRSKNKDGEWAWKEIEITEKTRSDYKSTLHDFFVYCRKRGVLKLSDFPEFPEIKYELGYRKVTTWETQSKVIDQINKKHVLNPKAGLAIEILAHYPKLRPDDIRRLIEGDYDQEHGTLVFTNPTKLKNKFKVVRLIPELKERLNEIVNAYPGLPHIPLFRHSPDAQTPEKPFGKNFLYKIWKNACKEIGLEGVSIYPGTKHTTTTEFAKRAGTEKAKQATGLTNKAFERYCLSEDETAFEMAEIRSQKSTGKVIDFKKKGAK